jgi:hypothetical protein
MADGKAWQPNTEVGLLATNEMVHELRETGVWLEVFCPTSENVKNQPCDGLTCQTGRGLKGCGALPLRHHRHRRLIPMEPCNQKRFRVSLRWLRPFCLLFGWRIAQLVDLIDFVLLRDGLVPYSPIASRGHT